MNYKDQINMCGGLSAARGVRTVSSIIDRPMPPFMKEYICAWDKGQDISITATSSIINKEETSMEERLNEFLETNNIKVNEQGNFEMYVVVDENDKDHEPNAIFPISSVVYTLDQAYEKLKANNNGRGVYVLSSCCDNNNKSQKSTKEILLKESELKIFKLLINKNNAKTICYKNSFFIGINYLEVSKYKVISEVELKPEIAFEINSMNDEMIYVKLYNTVTKKERNITINYNNGVPTKDELKQMVNNYLDRNEKETKLINDSRGTVL